MLYRVAIELVVTSDSPERAEREVFDYEFEAANDRQAFRFADEAVDDLAGPTGVETLIADGWVNPIVEGVARADVYCGGRHVADFVAGTADLSDGWPWQITPER